MQPSLAYFYAAEERDGFAEDRLKVTITLMAIRNGNVYGFTEDMGGVSRTAYCGIVLGAPATGGDSDGTDFGAKAFKVEYEVDVYGVEATTTLTRKLFTLEMRGKLTHPNSNRERGQSVQ
jgi:hypothetical protein